MNLLPTRRLAVVTAVVALAMLAFPLTGAADDLPIGWAVLVVTAVLVAIGLLDGAIGTRPRQLVVERHHPPVVELGREATMTWVIRSDAKRTLRVQVSDSLAPSLHAGAHRLDLLIPSGGTARTSTRFRPTRRGRFALDVLTVRIVGRLGLGARQRSVPLATVLRVHPAFPSREEAEIRIRRARILDIGLRSFRGIGGGTEFEQLREYGPDDEFRRIDWTATARTGKPIVRTYRAERNQSVLVMLDNGRIMAGKVAGGVMAGKGRSEGVPRVEHAMDAAMMLTAVSSRLGDRCGLVAFDRRVREVVPPARHADQVGRVAEALYRLQPELAESDYTGAFAEVVARYRRRAMLVVLTDLNEQAVLDSVLPALPLVTRTHLVVVAAVRDPQVVAWAEARPNDDEEVYRRVAAVQALADRERTTVKLRALGATVVDAEPGRLGVEVTDAYLAAKSSGRL